MNRRPTRPDSIGNKTRKLRIVAVLAMLAGLLSSLSFAGSVPPASAGPNIWTGVGPRALQAISARDGSGGVFAVSTGPAEATYNGYPATTVYHSGDGGQSWSPVGSFSPASGRAFLSAIAIGASADGATVLVNARDNAGSALLRSTNSGATFAVVQPSFETSNIVFDPSDGRHAYTNSKNGFYRSVDGGQTWELMPDAATRPTLYGRIAVDPVNTAHLVAGTPQGVKTSDDYGSTWTPIPTTPDPGFPVLYIPRMNGMTDSLVMIGKPGSASIALASDIDGLYVSHNAGLRWRRLDNLPGGAIRGLDGAQGRMYVAIRPASQPVPGSTTPVHDSELIYTSPDGDNWTLISRVPSRRDPDLFLGGRALFVSQFAPNRVFRNDGTFSPDGGQSWLEPNPALPLVDLPVTAFAVTPDGWVAGSGQMLFTSTNQGRGSRNWELTYGGSDGAYDRITGAHFDTRVLLVHLFPALLTGGPGGHYERQSVIMRSTDHGTTWSGPVLATNGRDATFIRTNSSVVSVPSAIYAAVSPNTRSLPGPSGQVFSRQSNGGLYKSTDDGATWVTLTVGIAVNNVLADPFDGLHLWAAGDDGLAETRDAGATWTRVVTNPQVGGYVMGEQGKSNALYAYAVGGLDPSKGVVRGPLYHSTDAGRTWSKVSIVDAPANYIVNAYTVVSQTGLVVAWTAPGSADLHISSTLDRQLGWMSLNGLGLGNGPLLSQLAFDTSTGSVLAPAGRLLSYMLMMAPADPNFQLVWQRQDQPILKGVANRSWTWGPIAFSTMREPLAGLPDNSRTVQYYDKSRMEVNDPRLDRSQLWFVTNGLLTVEMVAGRVQVGLDAWEPHAPSQVPVAGDGNRASNPNAPTYASFRGVASYESDNNVAPDRTGQLADRAIDAAGGVSGNIPAQYPVRLAQYDSTSKHNIAAPFWQFLNRTGKVFEDGRYVDRPVFGDWVFVMGRPISEPYWARMKVQGKDEQWVLIQLFERRVLTYTPTNEPQWQVEMGNVGLHYYIWRYGEGR